MKVVCPFNHLAPIRCDKISAFLAHHGESHAHVLRGMSPRREMRALMRKINRDLHLSDISIKRDLSSANPSL
jgi:hypothetical protein